MTMYTHRFSAWHGRLKRDCFAESASRGPRLGYSCQVSCIMVYLALGGCATTGVSPLGHSVRQIPDVDPARVFRAAEAALLREGLVIDRRDVAAGVVTSLPAAIPRDGVLGSPGLGLSSRGPARRVALIRIKKQDGIMRISCRVELQEQITEARRMFGQDYSGLDRPDDTPIDRGAAATREQNTVWRVARRDKRAERRILSTLTESLGL